MNLPVAITAFCISSMFCASTYAQSQMEMNQTAQANFEKADAHLNALYKKTLASLDTTGKKKLIAAERAWVAFRDAEADFEADSERGGSMAPMVYSQTCLELTEARIKQLSGSASN